MVPIAISLLLLLGYFLREYSLGKLTALEVGMLSANIRRFRLRYVGCVVVGLLVFVILRFSIPTLTNLFFLIFLSLCAIATIGFEMYGWHKCIQGKYSRAFSAPYTVSRVFTNLGAPVPREGGYRLLLEGPQRIESRSRVGPVRKSRIPYFLPPNSDRPERHLPQRTWALSTLYLSSHSYADG
jgi:hypothetical protein